MEKHDALDQRKLQTFRRDLDLLAARHRKALFVSFADSVIIKMNWDHPEAYAPEETVRVAEKVRALFQRHLGLNSYTVIAQGALEDAEKETHSVSKLGSHIAINSLGTQFMALHAIDYAARQNVKKKIHARHDIYLDEDVLLSVRFRGDRPSTSYEYSLPGRPSLAYHATSTAAFLDQLDPNKPKTTLRWEFYKATQGPRLVAERAGLEYRVGGSQGFARWLRRETVVRLRNHLSSKMPGSP